MESLSDTPWDVVIEGTGLQQSLLALALSRSNKKVLHVDQNEYYGSSEAAFSLQDVDEWVEKVNTFDTKSFRNAAIWKSPTEAGKLGVSRAYTLTLSPQIIYTKSKLLSQLVSSKVYKQLEFQAVGNWWIYDVSSVAALKRLPNGREDIFEDASIDNRSKRSLMKFLKFVVEYQNHGEIWEAVAENSFPAFLTSHFKLPESLQTVLVALTLSLDSPDDTPVGYALPRIQRHLSSIGLFGPGFGAVLPKWGGGAEIAQVACRAGAVGGGVYVLGTGIKSSQTNGEKTEVVLSNSETIVTKHLAHDPDNQRKPDTKAVSKVVAIVSSPFSTLFKSSVEGSPLAAVSFIVFPLRPSASKARLIRSTLWHTQAKRANVRQVNEQSLVSLDLAFHDEALEEVETKWNAIVESADEQKPFMQFEERTGMTDEDDDNENGY
ncbi:Rab escort [Hyphodiscus hymeniophilus]|uniref:Rab escort n=1 Tax=Hyphodiscus hymeniophilus TaxID=353542 RepID=A0A9P6VPZ9_9HELO|nr:Rab escort [Hyphodiscus hymeniophilus]